MMELYHSICAQLPGEVDGVFQFIGTHKGVGASTLLRTFAMIVSSRVSKSVLILDADPRASQAAHFSLRSTLCSNKPNAIAVRQISNSKLYLAEVGLGGKVNGASPGLPHAQIQLAALRNHYDLVLIDSSPANESSDSIALAKHTNGVIIVLEAEKTRWQVAQSLKEKIERQGAQILGTVLNGRRHYIPDAIYRRL